MITVSSRESGKISVTQLFFEVFTHPTPVVELEQHFCIDGWVVREDCLSLSPEDVRALYDLFGEFLQEYDKGNDEKPEDGYEWEKYEEEKPEDSKPPYTVLSA